MHITHFGHACVLVEIGNTLGTTTRILLDPGSFSTGLADLGPVDAVLVTHEHVDHVDPSQIHAIRKTSPLAPMYGGPGTAEVLRNCGVEPVELVENGQLGVAGVRVEVVCGQHEPVHPEVPTPANYAYLIGESVLHPGDCWTEVARPVDTLLLPIGGPWMKLAEAVEYVRRVRPRVAIPIHQQGLVPEHQHLHIGVLTRLAPEGTDVMALELGQPASI
jgi:L-ascorbate metabolism protein UlaG (beta-lactamase superfamily)